MIDPQSRGTECSCNADPLLDEAPPPTRVIRNDPNVTLLPATDQFEAITHGSSVPSRQSGLTHDGRENTRFSQPGEACPPSAPAR
jgi:hypothetical protein